MRRQFKFLICLSLLCMIFYSNIGTTSVNAAQHSKTQSIHLKINKYFILYSQPHPPFIDNKYRLLIPLRSIQGLMGGTVTYDETIKKAVVKWLDREFELVIGSTQAKVNGVPIQMDTVPILKDSAMFLPMRLFLDHTNVSYKWDQKKQLLHITDERAEKGLPFEYFAGFDPWAELGKDAFDLLSYKLIPKKLGWEISIKAKNIAGQKIPAGKVDIHPLVSYVPPGGFSSDAYSRPPSYPKPPALDKDSVIEITRNIGDIKRAEYIISVGRQIP